VCVVGGTDQMGRRYRSYLDPIRESRLSLNGTPSPPPSILRLLHPSRRTRALSVHFIVIPTPPLLHPPRLDSTSSASNVQTHDPLLPVLTRMLLPPPTPLSDHQTLDLVLQTSVIHRKPIPISAGVRNARWISIERARGRRGRKRRGGRGR
jgi:hypothetical protein